MHNPDRRRARNQFNKGRAVFVAPASRRQFCRDPFTTKKAGATPALQNRYVVAENPPSITMISPLTK
jgi:hypothetical protein